MLYSSPGRVPANPSIAQYNDKVEDAAVAARYEFFIEAEGSQFYQDTINVDHPSVVMDGHYLKNPLPYNFT